MSLDIALKINKLEKVLVTHVVESGNETINYSVGRDFVKGRELRDT